LGDQYVCTVEKYVYLLAEDDSIRRMVSPDVTEERETFEQTVSQSIGSHSVATLEPQVLKLPAPPQTELKYLTIRDREGGEIVTVIELLSPVNKARGEGQQEYLRKRTEFVRSPAHIVEIDLLRGESVCPMKTRCPQLTFLLPSLGVSFVLMPTSTHGISGIHCRPFRFPCGGMTMILRSTFKPRSPVCTTQPSTSSC